MEVFIFNLTNGRRVLDREEPSTEEVFLPKLSLIYNRRVESTPGLITFDFLLTLMKDNEDTICLFLKIRYQGVDVLSERFFLQIGTTIMMAASGGSGSGLRTQGV